MQKETNGSISIPLLEKLIVSLQCFPGVGVKSAQRMALYLLQRNREDGFTLATLMQEALTKIDYCQSCRSFTENDFCNICLDKSRLQDKLCVVHSYYDVIAMEETQDFKGLYFVLHGALSPIDGIDSDALAIDKLVDKIKTGNFQEVILATNSNADGEMTSYYIKQHIANYVPIISKLAQGIPSCSEVELLDINTLTMAFNERKVF